MSDTLEVITGDEQSEIVCYETPNNDYTTGRNIIDHSNQASLLTTANYNLEELIKDNFLVSKTCQVQILDRARQSYRNGMFSLSFEQHNTLIELNGVYLFIVYTHQVVTGVRLVRARDIEFKNQLTWTAVFPELY